MNATFLVCVPAQGAKEPVRRAENETLCIGRTRDGNDVGLPGDKTLSTHHCEFFFKEDAWHVRDLDTESGTFVNGERVQETVLAKGAHIRMGVAEIVYTPDVNTPELVVLDDAAPRMGPPVGLTGPAGGGTGGESQLKIRPDDGTAEDEDMRLRPAFSIDPGARRAKVREIE